MWFVHRSLTMLVVIAGMLLPVQTLAAEPTNVSEAREIAGEAGDDVDAGRYQDALDKISKAEALYHAPTHMVIRAEALEGLGRLVEALDTYENLAAEPLSPTAPAAFRQAREDGRKRQVALIARVPSLLVLVTGADLANVTATLDGKPLILTADQATRCDPGKHALHLEAPGYRPIDQNVEFGERGGVVKLNLHLEKNTEPHVEPPPPPPPKPVPKGRTLLVPTIVSFGVGTLSIAAGAVTGGLAISNAHDLENQCNPAGRCPPTSEKLIDRGHLLGNISTATFVVGGAAVGTGVVLLILGKPKASDTGMLRRTIPLVGPGMVGIRGSF